MDRAEKPYKTTAGGGDNRVHYNARTQPSSCLIDRVDSDRDWIGDAAVDEPLYRDGKRGRAKLCGRHEMTLQWFVFLVLVTCLQSKHKKRATMIHSSNLILHLDVHRLVRLIKYEHLCAIQADQLLANEIDQSSRSAHYHVNSLLQLSSLILHRFTSPCTQDTMLKSTVRREEMLDESGSKPKQDPETRRKTGWGKSHAQEEQS